MKIGFVEMPNIKWKHFYSVPISVEGLANYYLWSKSSLPPVFVNDVLLLTARPISLCIVYGCICVIKGELNHCNKDTWPTKLKIFSI